ncbi:hypothetical protein [Streptomyces sp. NPDC097619]|uniref:hypothetical protein n=1 Tax=Streptomyces sp. NPDC097619 TaxID=3157228 RepID=UPI003334703A
MRRTRTRTRTRKLGFGLYADEEGLEWVRGLVDEVVGRHAAGTVRIVRTEVVREYPGSGLTTAELHEMLAEQWAVERPGVDGGAREPVELHVRLECSLRNWHAVRKGLIAALCPEGNGPHACRVPWTAL